jgi:hypothetical protein
LVTAKLGGGLIVGMCKQTGIGILLQGQLFEVTMDIETIL